VDVLAAALIAVATAFFVFTFSFAVQAIKTVGILKVILENVVFAYAFWHSTPTSTSYKDKEPPNALEYDQECPGVVY